jgi:hypothetical protein
MERCELDASDSGKRPMAASCELGNEPLKVTSWLVISFSRRTLLHGVYLFIYLL